MPPGRRAARHAPRRERARERLPAAPPPGAIARRPPNRHPAATGLPQVAAETGAPPAAAARPAAPAAGHSRRAPDHPTGHAAPQAYRTADHRRSEPPAPAPVDRADQLRSAAVQSAAVEPERRTDL